MKPGAPQNTALCLRQRPRSSLAYCPNLWHQLLNNPGAVYRPANPAMQGLQSACKSRTRPAALQPGSHSAFPNFSASKTTCGCPIAARRSYIACSWPRTHSAACMAALHLLPVWFPCYRADCAPRGLVPPRQPSRWCNAICHQSGPEPARLAALLQLLPKVAVRDGLGRVGRDKFK